MTSVPLLPLGSTSKRNGGPGLFYDSRAEKAIEVWVDTNLSDRGRVVRQLVEEGARISTLHWTPETTLLILSPKSVPIFDMYCHPDWLAPAARNYYNRQKNKEGFVERWRDKVILRAAWVSDCVAAGSFLGEEFGWGGCRVGAPLTDLAKDVRAPPPVVSPPEELGLEGNVEEEPVDIEVEDVTLESAESRGVGHGSPSAHRSPSLPDLPDPRPLSVIEMDEMDVDQMDALAPSFPSVEGSSSPARQRLPVRETSSDSALDWAEGRSASPAIPSVDRSASLGDSEIEELVEEDELVQMEDSEGGPSKPPTPTNPSTIFKGLRFWVDSRRPNRGELIRKMLTAGGTIVTEYSAATHVLVHAYTPSVWAHIIKDVVRQGIWVLHAQWATKSLERGVRLPELGMHVPSGAPILLEDDDVPSTPATKTVQRIKPKEMQEIIEKEAGDLGVTELSFILGSKYGTYTYRTWQNHIRDYRNRQKRLAGDLPTPSKSIPSPSPSKTPPAQPQSPTGGSQHVSQEYQADQTTSAAQPASQYARCRTSTEDLLKIMEGVRPLLTEGKTYSHVGSILAAQHGYYGELTWAAYVGEWVRGTGRFKEKGPEQSLLPPKLPLPDPTRSVTASQTSGPSAGSSTGPTAAPASQPAKSKPKELDLEPGEDPLEKAYRRALKHSLGRTKIGQYLRQLCPTKSSDKWRQTYEAWLIAKTKGAFTDAQLNAIFAAEDPNADENIVSARLLRKHQVYDFVEWRKAWQNWHQSGTATEPQPSNEPSVSGRKDEMSEEERNRIFEAEQDRFKNLSTKQAGDWLAENKGQHAATSWALFYTQWKHKMSPADLPVRQMLTSEAREELFQSVPPHVAKMSIKDKGQWFADNYGTYHPSTWSAYYRQWRRKKDASKSDGSPAESSISLKRSSDTPHPASASPNKRWKAYTDEEEMDMARYIVSRLPQKTKIVKDWQTFADSHVQRSAAAYAEHYRTFKARIDNMTKGLLGERASSVSSDDSITYIHPPPKQAPAYVDITEDSD